MKRAIKLILIIVFVLMFSTTVFGQQFEDIVNLEEGSKYTSNDLNRQALELAERYPELLKYELLGYSFDERPIYSLVMTANIENLEEVYVDKMHYLTIAGTHSREDINPVLTLKMVEQYAKAYYNGGYYGKYYLPEIFERSVFHFLPSVNPDGFDLVRQGFSAAKTDEAKRSLTLIKSNNYNNFKANMRGVDLNRNFPTIYLNKETGRLEDYWDVVRVGGSLYSSVPHSEFYAGTSSASEVETRIITNYMDRYDHRNVVSMHSRGQILYWNKPNMSISFTEGAYRLATEIGNVSGYKVVEGNITEPIGLSGSGYESDYSATQLNKPLITVETLPAVIPLPTAQKYYIPTYDQVKYIPLAAEEVGHNEGYLPYRLYVEGEYQRDFIDKDYANAHALDKGGLIVNGEGKPKQYLGELVTRLEFVEKLIQEHLVFVDKDTDIEPLKTIGLRQMFLQEPNEILVDMVGSVELAYALSNGVINGGNLGNLRLNEYITPIEASIITSKLEKVLKEEFVEYNKSNEEIENRVRVATRIERKRDREKETLPIEVEETEQELSDIVVPDWAKEEVKEVINKGYINKDTFSNKQKYLDKQEFNFEIWTSILQERGK